MKKKISSIIFDNLKTLIGALIIAILIRSLLFQPFYIPSSSMEPTLLVGDRIFVSKYTYGYSRHSFPFSPNFSNERFFSKIPERGDLVVFKTPADNRTDYIKRLIGMPGDTIQFVNGDLLINRNKIRRDCSKDSRYLDSVGYVSKLNLVGEAQLIFFSNDTNKSSLLKFWNLGNSFRFERLFKVL